MSGIKPRYLAVDLNLPPEMTEDELTRMWKTVDSECKKLGITVVTGHTARYAGCNYPKFLEKRYGTGFVKKAQDVYYQMSTVKDALACASCGGVTAMHDATECGVFGGLYEMAAHSNIGMNVYLNKIILQDAVRKTCECFGIDPYSAISEGTLLATVKEKSAKKIVNALKRENIPASIVGEVTPERKGIRIIEKNRSYKLDHPKIDPFWGKFEEYLKK